LTNTGLDIRFAAVAELYLALNKFEQQILPIFRQFLKPDLFFKLFLTQPFDGLPRLESIYVDIHT